MLYGPKSLRECFDIKFSKCDINSVEFGWKCSGIEITDSLLQSEYVFLNSKDISLKNVEMTGKYSFQYVDNLLVERSADFSADNLQKYGFYVKYHRVIGESLGAFPYFCRL